MGFDVLYVLVHAIALLFWGSYGAAVPIELRFMAEVMVRCSLHCCCSVCCLATRTWPACAYFTGNSGGLLFRELADLALRVFDPSEFSIQQQRHR